MRAERLERVAEALGDAVDAKGGYAPSHARRVAKLAVVIAAQLGTRGTALQGLRLAGLLHDVGKLLVPDALLLKPGGLTASEEALVRHHPVDGHAIVLALGLPDEARWVLHHHERHDGTGYPTGLAGAASPFGARVLAVADAYETMTAGRAYRAARPPAEALEELRAQRGRQFDPAVVDALADVLDARLGMARQMARSAGAGLVLRDGRPDIDSRRGAEPRPPAQPLPGGTLP